MAMRILRVDVEVGEGALMLVKIMRIMQITTGKVRRLRLKFQQKNLFPLRHANQYSFKPFLKFFMPYHPGEMWRMRKQIDVNQQIPLMRVFRFFSFLA